MVAVVAATFGTVLAPIVDRVAARVGFLDRPDGHHKRHRAPVPLGGGILVFLSAVAGLASVAFISPVVRLLFERDASLVYGYLTASILLLTVGVVDDGWGMRGRHKLLGQVVAALLLTGYGLEVRQLELLGWTFDLGVMAVPFTVLWLLGAINAMNLLDGIDGLAGTVGLLISMLVACTAIISGQAFAALVALALAGGCLAFISVNLPPARMFLGDAGSMLIGLMLGGLTISCCSNGPGLLSVAPAAALLAVPILDSVFALLRRRLTGRSIYMTDQGHLHHCLLHALQSHRAVLFVTAMACLASGVGALLSVHTKNDVVALLSGALMALVFIGLRLFGYVECRLLLSTLAVHAARLVRRPAAGDMPRRAQAVCVRLQGQRQWNLLWESLTERAQKLQLLHLELDVNLPAMKEGFHASWHQPSPRERHECWCIELPLFVRGRPVGRLQASGERREQPSAGTAVTQFIQLLGPFEHAFAEFAAFPDGVHDRREAAPAAAVAGRRFTDPDEERDFEQSLADDAGAISVSR